jgi:hypothetical protein
VNRNSDTTGRSDFEQRFDAAMLGIYERAGREVAYWATRYLQMLRRRGARMDAKPRGNPRAIGHDAP